jgi:hypothetical protein
MKTRIPVSQTVIICTVFLVVAALSPVCATIFTVNGSDITETELYELTNGTSPSGEIDPVTYFYDPDCESCQEAGEFFTTFLTANPEVPLEKLNIFNETGEVQKFYEFKTRFSRENLYVPVVFVGPVGLEGASDIRSNFRDVYQWYNQSSTNLTST